MFELLLAHLIGDFLLQNDYLASGKKTSSGICTVHVMFYLVPFMSLLSIGLLFLSLYQGLLFLSLVGLQHWLQDRWSVIPWFMRLARQHNFAKAPMAPWSVIVVDNTWHLLFIYVFYKLVILW